jgi:hypothetical protein
LSWFFAGCCSAEFDTTFPIHLNGIIGQGEFVESIEKINRTIFVNGTRKTISILYILFVLVSTLCFVFGVVNIVDSPSGFPTLFSIGMGLIFGGTFVFIIGMVILQVRQATKMRQAIAEESAKYSARSTSCSWRLETTTFFAGYGNNRQVTYHVSINI